MRFLTAMVPVFVGMQVLGTSAGELTRDVCRSSDDASVLADCIERRIYHPCDEAGSRIGDVRCIVGRREVAERRIERATRRIAELSKQAGVIKRGSVNRSGVNQPPRDHVVDGNKLWDQYVWEHCLFLNELDSVSFIAGEPLGFCEARLMEDRAAVLEQALRRMTKAK